MENLFIVTRFDNELYTVCCPEKKDDALKRAEASYKESQSMCAVNLMLNCKTKDDESYWKKQFDRYEKILNDGFAALTEKEYFAAEREKWLSKEPMEITEKEYDDALCCLPPVNWVQLELYSMFHISEGLSGTYHGQYLYDKRKNKYYYAVTDIFDSDTWVDKMLNLR